MSISNIDEISNEDFLSSKSNISDLSQSSDSVNKKINPNELNSIDMCHRISNLQDIRYDATYKISQLKQRILDIEKQEMSIMKESTIQHSNLQENYIKDYEAENSIKKLAEETAIKLGKMKFELKIINEKVQLEQEKLEELEEQSERLKKRLEECGIEEKSELLVQSSIIEEQRDQQAKIFEDLEFKELETQSRFEEESETLKSNIIEAQRKLIMSTRNRENRKLFYDEQQILLMKTTRKTLDRLESERNTCNSQISHYQNILSTCTSQIEEFNHQASQIDYTKLTENLKNLSNSSFVNEDEKLYFDNFESIACKDFIVNQSMLVGSSYNQPIIQTNYNNNLQDRLNSLTEIVKMNLKIPLKSESKFELNTTLENCSENYSKENLTGSYPSTFSFYNDVESINKTNSIFSVVQSIEPPTVTFECASIEDISSSNQSPGLDSHDKSSRSDINSEISNTEDNNQLESQIQMSIIGRNKNRRFSKNAKQSRPLTCFLPKLHSDFNLLKHVETCGHDLTVCGNHVEINQNSCQGFLWKLSNRLFGVWKKYWFCFDHKERQLTYYNSKSKLKIKGSIDFQNISDVFVDHTHRGKNPQKLTLCIETQNKSYYLIAAKPELVTLWVDVIFTGAEAYLTLHSSSMISSFVSQNSQ